MALTPKQEKFCKLYIELGNASEAYRQSYSCEKMKPESINRLAKAQLDNIKIASRLDELRSGHAKRHNIVVDDLIDELEEARQVALSAIVPQSSAAVSATMGKAKILGLIIDKNEHSGPGGGPIQTQQPKDLTDAELAAELAKYGLKP